MCGYYHLKEGDIRVIHRLNSVYNFCTMRAFPMQHVMQDELTNKIQEIVLDNPNHVKEFLFNLKISGFRADELAQILRTKLSLS